MRISIWEGEKGRRGAPSSSWSIRADSPALPDRQIAALTDLARAILFRHGIPSWRV
jgi:hypothetical protein